MGPRRPTPSLRSGWSPVFFAKGFRPFFVLAAAWAAAIVPIWLLVRAGALDVGGHFLPAYWHAHEMVFGFATAVVAGFLLTAVSNWTERETARGGLLIALAALWVAGRAALLASDRLPPTVVSVVSVAFLPALAVVVGRAIFLAKSRRNYGIVAALGALFAAQLATHAGALEGSLALQRAGTLVGMDLVLVLVGVIGGRVIPLFTRNATGATDIASSPALDRAAIASLAGCALADALSLGGLALAIVTGLAAVLGLLRARRWGTRHTGRDPLLWILHAGYFCLPLGLGLRALASLTPSVPASAALHVLTVGTIGLLTLGMMARVALGHTGRPLKAPPLVTAAFVCLLVATFSRVVGPMLGGALSTPSLHLSATAWSLAFALYLVAIGPMLVMPRPDGRPG